MTWSPASFHTRLALTRVGSTVVSGVTHTPDGLRDGIGERVTELAPKRALASIDDSIRNSSLDEGVRLPVGRRGFLRLAAGGVVGGAAWLGVGCSGDDDDPPVQSTPGASATPEATATPADAPRRGGTLRMGQGADLSLAAGHPFALVSQNRILAYAAHETLVQYVGSLDPQPLLAERFEVTPDFQRVIVTLKPDLEFHNSAPVTADDVAFSVEAVRDPTSAGLPATTPLELAGLARTVTGIKVVDARTVEFTLDRPRANIADFFAQLHIAHRASFAGIAQGDVVGTGPFSLAQWDRGRAYRLERFDNWHGAAAHLDAIEVAIYDPTAACDRLPRRQSRRIPRRLRPERRTARRVAASRGSPARPG